MPKWWGNSFDFKNPEGEDKDKTAQLIEDNKTDFNDVEQFMMIAKDWFEGLINEYDDISAANQAAKQPVESNSNEMKVMPDHDVDALKALENNDTDEGTGTNWTLYAVGAAVLVAGGYLALNLMNK